MKCPAVQICPVYVVVVNKIELFIFTILSKFYVCVFDLSQDFYGICQLHLKNLSCSPLCYWHLEYI